MSELPDGWRREPLGRLGSFLKGRGGPRRDDEPTGVPVVRYGELYTHHHAVIREFHSFLPPERAREAYTPLNVGDLLLAGSGETADEIGKAAVFLGPEPAYAAGDTIIFRPGECLDPLFLGYTSNGPEANAYKTAVGQGSSVVHIYVRDLEDLQISVPPVPEQRKIAALLSSVDAAIGAARDVIEQIRRVQQHLLHTLMTRGIGHTRFKETEIGRIPEAWGVVPASHVAEGGNAGIVGGPFGSNLTSKDYIDPPGVPVIRGTNLNYEHGTFRLHGFVYVSEEKADQLARNLAFPGDLIMTQRGSLGQVGLIPKESPFDRFVVSQSQMRLTPDRAKIRPRFLWYYANSKPVLNWIESHTIATGVPHINLGLFRRLPVPAIPLEEQEEILCHLDRLQGRIDLGVTELTLLERLMRGLLQHLLTGRVRV